MRVLDELEREIERVATEAGEVRRRRSGARLAVLPLSFAAVAVAAAMIVLVGGGTSSPPGKVAKKSEGALGALAGPGKLLGIVTEDPAGGPPWGLRVTRTTRGYGCVEAGRVVDGKLGSIGQDGTFHERAPSISPPANCQLPDAKGRLFIAMTYMGTSASGDPRSCNPQRATSELPKCPRETLRTIYYGLLGPDATAVTYKDGERLVRQAVGRPEGAYLVVKRTPKARRNVGYFSPGVSPGSGLQSVEYSDDSTCRIPDPRRIGGGRSCPVKGYVEPKLPTVSPADLASTVRVQVGTRPEQPPGVEPPKRALAARRVTIRFRARVAADVRSFYTFTYQVKDGGEGCSSIGSGPISRDIAAGTIVRQDVWVSSRCRGTLQVEVGYAQQRKPADMPFMQAGLGNAYVGRAQAKVG